MANQWWVDMSVPERARGLVGDMPWVTEHLSKRQVDDLIRQIETSMWAAVNQERAALLSRLDEVVEVDLAYVKKFLIRGHDEKSVLGAHARLCRRSPEHEEE